MNSSVSIRDLSLGFGSVNVLQNLNLEIGEGEFLVLLGPSGCGKSTLLNCVAGLLDISEGSIFIKGRNVTWEEPKDRGIGMVFQSYALYPQMTVEKNLSFGLRVAGLPKGGLINASNARPKFCRSNPCCSANLRHCPADNVSVLRSVARWCAMSTCFCSMNRFPIWMQNYVLSCALRSSAFTRNSAIP